ncbi:MAG: hypothetical protein SWX82_11740 [Cyanobacteriota bacterium]|nr:hypothetical protein [Cyanobacteriota bacterium]
MTNKANIIGTGFPFSRQQNHTYFLTCTNAVENVGGKENVLFNNG